MSIVKRRPRGVEAVVLPLSTEGLQKFRFADAEVDYVGKNPSEKTTVAGTTSAIIYENAMCRNYHHFPNGSTVLKAKGKLICPVCGEQLYYE